MVLDPNVLNPFALLGPAVAQVLAAIITTISVTLSVLISRYFFKSYRFSGFGYLLGFPVGFAFLGASFVLEISSIIFRADPFLYPAFFWIQMLLQSEAFALIALSYYYKNSDSNQSGRTVKPRDIIVTTLPLAIVAIPFIVPTSALASSPYFNYARLADLSFLMRIFDIAIVAFIVRSTVASLVKSGSLKMLYVPAAFALLALEQYSLIISYFDNSVAAFIGSLVARVLGLGVFAYTLYNATSKRRREIEARKAT
jgi:hypothetical protein